MSSAREIINKAAITTGSLSNGLLNPEQARKFIQQTFEATTLSGLTRNVIRTAKTGEIDKIGIAKRILRRKIENVDDGYRAGVNTDKISYATTQVRLPWEITGETLRENIEGEDFETIVTNLMTKQMGCDLEDLQINGDESTASTDPDYDFLKINDGWRKQLLNGSHVYDASSESRMSLDIFYSALKQIPNKYNNGNLRWLMSPARAQEWEQYLLNQVITNGGAVPESIYKSPASIPSITVPSLDDRTIILTDPQNLISVRTYDVMIKSTEQGKEAIMQDKKFYVIHFDFDAIIEELDAAGIIKNLPV